MKGTLNFNLGIDITMDDGGFVEIPDDEIDQFILEEKVKSTKDKDVSDLNVFMQSGWYCRLRALYFPALPSQTVSIGLTHLL